MVSILDSPSIILNRKYRKTSCIFILRRKVGDEHTQLSPLENLISIISPVSEICSFYWTQLNMCLQSSSHHDENRATRTISSAWDTKQDNFYKSTAPKHTLHFLQFPVKLLVSMPLVCTVIPPFKVL